MESRGGFGTHPRVGFFTHRQQVQGGRKPALGLQENYPVPSWGQGLSFRHGHRGGEFLLSLGHPYSRTSATEAYPPNAELCRRLLAPLGIDFREAPGNQTLPFADSCFDMVINRHGNYDAGEVNRILKPGGIFITQQVGEDNDRELVELLLPGTPKPFPGMNLQEQSKKLKESGFDILEQGEAFRPIRFFDVGALVWFAKIIEWEFPGFCVDGCLDRLAAAQALLESGGSIEGTIHRYMMTARKREPVYLEPMY